VDDNDITHHRTLHASGVDDDDLNLSFAVRIPNPVPSSGHSKRALLGHFCRAPKKDIAGSDTEDTESVDWVEVAIRFTQLGPTACGFRWRRAITTCRLA
jgi:hypothetical protein